MKTLLMTLFMGLVFLLPSETATTTAVPQSPESTTLEDDKKWATTRIYVHFGRKRRNCTGFGICAAYVNVRNNSGTTSTTIGFSGNRLVYMRWKKKDVKKADQEKYFKDGIFRVEEDFNETLEVEGKKVDINLKAGKYKLKEDKEGFLLEVSG